MARKYWFEVRHGFTYRCGAEWDVYHVKAYNAEQAQKLVEEVFDKKKKGEDIKVEQVGEDWMYYQKFANGVMLTEHDYWSR